MFICLSDRTETERCWVSATLNGRYYDLHFDMTYRPVLYDQSLAMMEIICEGILNNNDYIQTDIDLSSEGKLIINQKRG